MSNEYPTRPTQICEPVYIGTSNIGKRVSTKKYKQSWHVFFGYYRRGRIKRMRTYLPFRGKHTNIRPFRKRMGEKAYTRIVLDFSFRRPPINRWNRH